MPAALFKVRTVINTYNTEMFIKGITFCVGDKELKMRAVCLADVMGNDVSIPLKVPMIRALYHEGIY
jgi:hypothetical protein